MATPERGKLDAIARLMEILGEFRVSRRQHLLNLKDHARAKLDRSIFAWFAAYREATIDEFKSLSGLNLCFPWSSSLTGYEEDSANGTTVKKSVMLSGTSLVTTPTFRHPDIAPQVIPNSWYFLTLEFLPLVRAGMLRIVPDSVTNIEHVGPVKGKTFVMNRPVSTTEKHWFFLGEHLPTLQYISFSVTDLKRQMRELGSQGVPSGDKVYIYLPHLSRVPPDLLAKIRVDYPDAFRLYNSTIRRMFDESAKADTESKILDILQRTDEEMRRVQAELSKLSRQRTLEAIGATVKLSIGVLCACLPQEYARDWKAIGALLTGSGALNDLKALIATNADIAALAKETPFHFPWLLHRRSK